MLDGEKIPEKAHANLSEAAQHVSEGLKRGSLEPFWLMCVMACIDTPVFSVAFWFAQYASTPTVSFDPLLAGGLALLGSILFVVLMLSTAGYNAGLMSKRMPFIFRSVSCVAVASACLILAAPVVSPGVVVTVFAVCMTAAILPTRIAIQNAVKWAIDTQLISRRAVVAGGGHQAEELIRGLAAKRTNDIRLIGIFDDRDDTRSPIQVLGVPKLGGYDELVGFMRASEIDMVIVALPLTAEERIEWLLQQFRVLPVEVRLAASSEDYSFLQSAGKARGSGFQRSFGPNRRFAKRAFDLCFASFALAFLWPVMIVVALAIRIESPGPVFFSQRRHGYNHREINVLKFRSMYHHAADPSARQNVVRNDPRVTRIGRFLRRSSIDELPQLLNVLRGELSLVGPRPHAVSAHSSQNQRFEQIVDGYAARHRLPPGITGWAQVNGWRGEIDDADKLVRRVEHDLHYIENWSLWLDFTILVRTPFALFGSEGAY